MASFVFDLAAATGVARRAHHWLDRGSLTIVAYHSVAAQPPALEDWCVIEQREFFEQIAYLKRHFDVLPLADAASRLRRGPMDRPVAAITFDDGYQNNHDVALPLLRQLDLPATVFLNTRYIGTGATVWFGHLNLALEHSASNELLWRGERYALSSMAARAAASAAIQSAVKVLDHDRMLVEVNGIVNTLGFPADPPAPEGSPYRMLDAASIQAMVRTGLIEFGAHTANHTILTRVDDARAAGEIAESANAAAALTGKPCRLFAYPNGGPGDYHRRHFPALEKAGIMAAVTTIEAPNLRSTPLFELRRYGIGRGLAFGKFQCMVHHQLARAKSAFGRNAKLVGD